MGDNKEVLMELAKQLISEEEIEYAVRQVIEKRVNYHVECEIQAIVHKIIQEKGEGYIVEMVDKVLSAPVKTDDGWGSVEKYDSFENFVRDKIRQKSFSRSEWDISRTIRDQVDKKISEIAAKLAKQEVKDRTDAVLKELASEYVEKN